ncbi:hypothetical protein [Streptomyces sp. NBC_01190]|uniref:hypothetical protein n=1 Tax=Streptomyces sp. NBC_01190 TaxID=2903767 RepID=UPI00386DE9F1|nr:hypothetical protein OG519_29005 [Streptomyces sp. NBC_01190]
MAPTDPQPFYFGARESKGAIEIKIPLCPQERVLRVSVIDADATEDASPPVIWSATAPKSNVAARGVFDLWSGKGFLRSSNPPAPDATPERIEVDYSPVEGDGTGDVFDLGEVRKARLAADQYWTYRGPRTADQIDAQLKCSREESDAGS